VEEEEEEEEYPHVLATPTQQSYFVQLSGLFESEFDSARVGAGGVGEEKRSESKERERKGELFSSFVSNPDFPSPHEPPMLELEY